MSSNPAATLTSLLRATTIEDHEDILKASNAVLKTPKADQNALHTRVVALLKLDRFDDALRALDDGGDKLAATCRLEKAYALYKLGNLEEAEKLIPGTAAADRGLLHVAAQVAYRSERFEDAAKIYQQLSEQEARFDGEENDLRINGSAADAQLEWQGKGDKVVPSRKKPSREDLEAFETAYNAACGCIARGDLATGSMLLKRARDLCEALDDLSDEEKRAEVLPIMLQQAYVLSRMGKLEEANALQGMINIADVPEPPTRAIAQNNALAISTTNDNPYLTERLFESVPTLSKAEKFFEYQATIVDRNRYTIRLQTQKYAGVVDSTLKLISQQSSPTTSPTLNGISVLNAAANVQCSTHSSGIKRLLQRHEKRPSDAGLLLTIIQLYVLNSKHNLAIELFESFFKRLEESSEPEHHEVRFAPGLVALLVSLYRSQGRREPVKSELRKAALYWRQQSTPSASLLKAAGIALLDDPSPTPDDFAAASDIFSSLKARDPSDKTAVAGFVASNAASNISQVQSELDKLTPISSLISGIDAGALEDAGIAAVPVPMSVSMNESKKRAAPAAGTTPSADEQKKKRIRKNKLPKDYVEGKVMDPERWLPLRERSNYKAKGKKGKKKANESTQGGVVREDQESLELVGGAGAVKVEKAGGGGGANKGKKKKGKR